MPPTHPETPDTPCKDMSITVGWNTAQAVGITREEMDAWAARSHQRAVAAIDAGKFVDEIIPLKVQQLVGSVIDFNGPFSCSPAVGATRRRSRKLII